MGTRLGTATADVLTNSGIGSFGQLKTAGPYRFEVTGTVPTDLVTYQPGTLTIKDANEIVMYSHAPQFRGRGNSTWGAPKKPFKVRAATKLERPFLYPASRDWALMADFYDESYIRSTIGFEIGRRATGRWHPRSTHGRLVWNGADKGLYRFSETADAQYGRVNIREMKNADVAGNALTGPYFVEVNESFNEPGFLTSRLTPVQYDTPDVLGVAAQEAFIAAFFETFENALVGGSNESTINGMIDIPSWVDWYLLMEVGCVIDAHFYQSIKFWKDQDAPGGSGKVVFGAPWDLDRSFGNHGGAMTGWRIRANQNIGGAPRPNWFWHIWNKSAAYRAACRARWTDYFVPVINAIDPFIDSVSGAIEPYVAGDRDLWYSGTARATQDTVAGLKSFIHGRTSWITANIGAD